MMIWVTRGSSRLFEGGGVLRGGIGVGAEGAGCFCNWFVDGGLFAFGRPSEKGLTITKAC